jgi:hypothetical protein
VIIAGSFTHVGSVKRRSSRREARQIDLHWHDVRHEGGRLPIVGRWRRHPYHPTMLGHSDIKATQRYLNITDEALRTALTGVWERRRQLQAVGE